MKVKEILPLMDSKTDFIIYHNEKAIDIKEILEAEIYSIYNNGELPQIIIETKEN